MAKLGECRECVVRESDHSEKRLYRCKFCGIRFCHRHSKPRLAYIPTLKRSRDSAWEKLLDEQPKDGRGHPDFQYTRERLATLEIEEREILNGISRFIDAKKYPDYPADFKKKPFVDYPTVKTSRSTRERCPKCGSSSIGTLGFDKKNESLQCRKCGYSWEQPREVAVSTKRINSNEAREKVKTLKPSQKLQVSLVACAIIIVILGASTFWYYQLYFWQQNQNETFKAQIKHLTNQKNTLAVEIGALEENISLLQEQISDLETQVDDAYDEGYDVGYVQGVTDGVGRGFNIRDPTYQEALEFIAVDQTDNNEYDEDNYNCFHFTADVEKNAFRVGYRCGFVYIELQDGAHAIISFNTTDYGLIFVEPQDDDIVTLTIGQPYWDRTKYEPLYNDTIVRFVIIW